jgi:hypothetical protein
MEDNIATLLPSVRTEVQTFEFVQIMLLKVEVVRHDGVFLMLDAPYEEWL